MELTRMAYIGLLYIAETIKITMSEGSTSGLQDKQTPALSLRGHYTFHATMYTARQFRVVYGPG